jgi:competence protein ComEC
LIETLIIDDEIIVRAEFKGVQKPLNPYSFDYKKYLKNQQIHHQVFLTKPQFFKRLKKDKTIYGLAAIIRSEINSSLKNNGFKNDELAVINALLLGQRQSISNDLMEDYIDAGAIHILAVSGLHIGVILMLLVFLFKPIHSLKNGKLIATVLIILLLWFYAVIAGLSASVVRAVAMFTALSIGMHLNKPSNVYNTLVISMFFLLLFNPYYLFEVGFQLSYAAVFSIVWIQPKLYQLISIKWWILDKGWQLFSVSIAAQIGILPLSLFYFHQFPGLFFIANLVIIPFLGFILIAGIVVISMSLLNILPAIVADFYIFIIQQMNAVVSWVSSIEYFIIQNISVSIVVMLVSYLSIILVLKWLEKTTFFRLILVFISIIIIQSVFIFEKMKRQSTNEFIVFNKGNSSMFGERIGSKITFFNSENVLNERISNSYLTGAGLKDVSSLQGIKKLYNFNNEKIVIIDSLGIYNFKTIRPTIFILQQSPKINLERLLKLHKPSLIIADGSNYKSVIKNWEETCLKNKTPFYNTMQKGAYVIKE